MILMLAVVVSGISYSQVASNSMLKTNIGNSQLTDINSTGISNTTNNASNGQSIWSSALLIHSTQASNVVTASETHNSVSRSFSPLSSQLSTGVSNGIILSSDAKTITNATVSAAAISNSNYELNSANPESGEMVAANGLLGGSKRPSSDPIGYVPVGNGIVVLLTLIGLYTFVLAFRRVQSARAKK